MRATLTLIDDAPIWAKASAASIVLLLCLVGLGTKAFFVLNKASTKLLHHSQVELPKQRLVSQLAGDIVATHLKTFRFVSWAQIGVGADNNEILSALDGMGSRLRDLRKQPNLSLAETEHMAVLSAQWDKYSGEIRAVLAAATTRTPYGVDADDRHRRRVS